ncbi:MAG: hypothetical protein R3C53_10305 [Pirellulaceae bacterium]
MTLGLVVSAQDHFDLDPNEHLGYGQPQQLAIVSEDQLVVMLNRQELELRRRLEIILSELQQVDEALTQLGSNLAPSEPSAMRILPAQSKAFSSLVASQNVPQAGDPSEQEKAQAELAQRQRMAVLRAQQSALQCDKSEQELSGIASRVDHLRLQLLNNRIDSRDRQERLDSKVYQPLVSLLGNEYLALNRSLSALQTATMSGQGFAEAQASLAALAQVLDVLNAIKENMLDIESFNEIVDQLRALLDEQESLLDETQKQQKARILDLLKGN